jgi:hypothetical protein
MKKKNKKMGRPRHLIRNKKDSSIDCTDVFSFWNSIELDKEFLDKCVYKRRRGEHMLKIQRNKKVKKLKLKGVGHSNRNTTNSPTGKVHGSRRWLDATVTTTSTTTTTTTTTV